MSAYKIIGVSDGVKETIDTAKDLAEAKFLAGEYQLAFGKSWLVYYTSRVAHKQEVAK